MAITTQQLDLIEERLHHIRDLAEKANVALAAKNAAELATILINIAQCADRLHTYLYDQGILAKKF
jgi:hypothetical protein